MMNKNERKDIEELKTMEEVLDDEVYPGNETEKKNDMENIDAMEKLKETIDDEVYPGGNDADI